MRIRFFTALTFSFIAALFIAFFPLQGKQSYNDNPSPEREQLIMRGIVNALDQLHYSPVELNDQLSAKAFQSYLDRLDSGRRFLTAKDMERLKQYELKIDDEFKAGSLEFFNLSVSIIDEAVRKPEMWYRDILNTPFNINRDESVQFDPEKLDYAADDDELQDYWRKFLKYEVITKLYRKVEQQEKNEDKSENKSIEELEEEIRKDVLKTFEDWFVRLSKLRRSDRFTDYINSVTELFDPHTNYFDPKDKEDFDINMSGRLEGIGARLQTDGEFTKVESIVPGGPAWKQKELEVNDQILKVTQEGGEPVDIRGMRIDDVVKQVRGKKGTKVILTVKKTDGTIQDINIVRDEVILDEGLAKSALLEHSEIIDNVGYIRLPRFYDDFNRKDGNSCAKDVANEIEKLKNYNVSGIILDLRNNGGGSLRDVIDMSGLFIESGPIVQVKSRGQEPQVLKDTDSKVQYDGPLIIMVNQFSASASEILAAALQDYERAIIVGSPATFGKGTVQRFYDLDRIIRGSSAYKPLGEIKVTMQKFYRINGGSTQLKGVIPDIILPDTYMYYDIGERDYEYPMEWSEISALDYSQNVYRIKNKEYIAARSKVRIESDTTFSLIELNAQRLKNQRDQSRFPLSLDAFTELMKQREAEAKRFENIMKSEIPGLQANNLQEDLAAITIDESKEIRNKNWLESLRKDVYLKESLHIMKDMIDSQNGTIQIASDKEKIKSGR